MSRMPEVCEYMTPTPLTATPDVTLAAARDIFTQHGIRHLPVVLEGKLVGMVSDRDLRLLGSVVGFDPKDVMLQEVMAEAPYSVNPHEPLDRVLSEMAERKLGSAIVVEDEKVVGLFTAIDALEAFSKLLRERFS